MAKIKKTPFAPWETRNTNGVEKRYIRLGVTQMASDTMRKLSPSAFKIYTYMKLESGGNKNFEFPHTKYKGWISKPTFFKAVEELESMGFIDIKFRNKNIRKPNVYSFSERWKQQ